MPTKIVAGEGIEALVGVAIRVARMHGTSLSLSDLLQLMPSGVTSDDLTLALQSIPEFGGGYTVKNGVVVPTGGGTSHVSEFAARQAKSLSNLSTARWLARALGRRGVRSIAVSGSTSYGAASSGDDVDLFCVTEKDSLWLFLVRALILTRASRIRSGTGSPLCLSCLADEGHAEVMFSADRGALFARDALVAEVISGAGAYSDLLRRGAWMKRYFPRLYAQRVDLLGAAENRRSKPDTRKRVLNLFLFATFGTYIRTKARYHNLLLARGQRSRASFRARVGPDHLIYESMKYLALKETYDDIQPRASDSAPRQPAPSTR